jgi:ketosteroid isomerase-like protein
MNERSTILLASLALLAATACHGLREVAAPGDTSAVAAVLDDFHAAAAAADEHRYFAHLAPNAVFLGTDATERWTRAEFLAYAHPRFAAGQGWTYVPRDRHVMLSADGSVAWFDERLDHARYGEVRGTGVLERDGGAWRIVHYNLSFPIPNDLAPRVVALIRGGG